MEQYLHTPMCIYTYTHTLLTLNSFPKFLAERKKTLLNFLVVISKSEIRCEELSFSSFPLKTLVINTLTSARQILTLFPGDIDYQFVLRYWFTSGESTVLHIRHADRTAVSIMCHNHPLADQRDRESDAVDDSKGQDNLHL